MSAFATPLELTLAPASLRRDSLRLMASSRVDMASEAGLAVARAKRERRLAGCQGRNSTLAGHGGMRLTAAHVGAYTEFAVGSQCVPVDVGRFGRRAGSPVSFGRCHDMCRQSKLSSSKRRSLCVRPLERHAVGAEPLRRRLQHHLDVDNLDVRDTG